MIKPTSQSPLAMQNKLKEVIKDHPDEPLLSRKIPIGSTINQNRQPSRRKDARYQPNKPLRKIHAVQNMKEEIPSNIIKSLGDINLEGHVLKGTKIKAMIASEARAIHVNPATRDKTKLVWRKNRTNKTTQARGNNLGEDLVYKVAHNNRPEICHKNEILYLRWQGNEIQIHAPRDISRAKEKGNRLNNIRGNNFPTRMIEMAPKPFGPGALSTDKPETDSLISSSEERSTSCIF